MANRYRYNGKELHDELGLGWYDYGFRWYDPAVARFVSVDPLAESFPELTTYQYASNSPIQNIDLDGLEGLHYIEGGQNVIEKNVVVIIQKLKPIPDNADAKTREKIGKKNANINRRNNRKVQAISGDLESFFNGSDGNGTQNTSGENTVFKFNISTKAVEDPQRVTPTEGRKIANNNKVMSSDRLRHKRDKKGEANTGPRIPIQAAVITSRSSGGSHGAVSEGVVNFGSVTAPSGTVSHELGHLFGLPDNNVSGSLMNSPPRRISPQEVTEIIRRSKNR